MALSVPLRPGPGNIGGYPTQRGRDQQRTIDVFLPVDGIQVIKSLEQARHKPKPDELVTHVPTGWCTWNTNNLSPKYTDTRTVPSNAGGMK
jgi:hypothetical protein